MLIHYKLASVSLTISTPGSSPTPPSCPYMVKSGSRNPITAATVASTGIEKENKCAVVQVCAGMQKEMAHQTV